MADALAFMITTGSVGTPDTQSIQNGSPNFHDLTLDAGKKYIFDVEGGPGTRLHDPNLRILDANTGQQLKANDDVAPGHLDSRIEFTPATSGKYSLEVTGKGPVKDVEYTL